MNTTLSLTVSVTLSVVAFASYSRAVRATGRVANSNASPFGFGDVVHFVGRRRRYVVVSVDRWGSMNLVALSGAERGCAPSGHHADELALDDDQIIAFEGPLAQKLACRANALASMLSS